MMSWNGHWVLLFSPVTSAVSTKGTKISPYLHPAQKTGLSLYLQSHNLLAEPSHGSLYILPGPFAVKRKMRTHMRTLHYSNKQQVSLANCIISKQSLFTESSFLLTSQYQKQPREPYACQNSFSRCSGTTVKQPKCFKSSPTSALSARTASEMAVREVGPLQQAPTANASYPGATAQQKIPASCLKLLWKCTSVSEWAQVTYDIPNCSIHTECFLSTTKGLKATASRNAQPHTQQQQTVNSTARPLPHPAAAWNLKTCPAKLSPTHKHF